MSARSVATVVCVFCAVSAAAAAETYCNPITLPDYPRGVFAQDDAVSRSMERPELLSRHGAFRETGDPTVLMEGKTWYLYSSSAENACWKSTDRGANWRRIDLGLPDFAFGYSPTVVRFRGKYLLTGGWGAWGVRGKLYRGDTPEGPFELVGTIRFPDNDNAPSGSDPMLFADGDRLYLYWGCTPTKGIWGCELDPENPCRPLTPGKCLIPYDPANHPWEKMPDKPFGFIEGAWVFKRNGGYYLVFAAAGTEYPTYATGVARASSPLGDFVLQKNNPVFLSTEGVVTGTAHGSVACDEDGEWWYFYSVHASVRHQFERRIGMDRLTFDENGDVVARAASSDPQPLPGSARQIRWPAIRGVSLAAGAAFDKNLETEFVPLKLPYEVGYSFLKPETVRANRVIWSDGGYDPKGGVNAGPVRYRVLLQAEDGNWTTAVDASRNDRDLLVDYLELPPTRAVAARLEVLAAPDGITPRVVEWTPFGECGMISEK